MDGRIPDFDIDSQLLENVVFAQWLFTDELSGILTHYMAVGTTPQGTDVMDWKEVGQNSTYYTAFIRGRLLLDNETYYTSVRAMNGAGLTTTLSSDGFTIGREEVLVNAGASGDVSLDRVVVDVPAPNAKSQPVSRTHSARALPGGASVAGVTASAERRAHVLTFCANHAPIMAPSPAPLQVCRKRRRLPRQSAQ